MSFDASSQGLESHYQPLLCQGMPQNRHLPNGTEVDCITDTHAIELEFTQNWDEAIGQSLQYASALERLPGIILICVKKKDLCFKHQLLLEQTVTYWRIGMTLWLCDADATKLSDCTVRELMQP
jgi:hypothetical protein